MGEERPARSEEEVEDALERERERAARKGGASQTPSQRPPDADDAGRAPADTEWTRSGPEGPLERY